MSSATSSPSAPSSAEGSFRWVICLLLFLATTVNYIDRQILALLKPMLDLQLGWTNEQFGYVNAAFQGAYGLGLLGFGAWVDRRGTKIGFAVAIAAWSAAAMGHALVYTVGGFVVARIALGLGEGGNFPSSIKAIAEWFPRRERAFATSLFNSGANVGAIIAPAIVPFVALHWGWRAAFVGAGIAGFVWLVLWLVYYDSPEHSRRVSEGELRLIRSDPVSDDDTEKSPGWRVVLRHREAWAFITAKFITDPVWWFFLIWLPDFFKQSRGLALSESWEYLVSIYVVVTVLSIFGGWITGYLARRGWTVTRARKTGMLIFALLVIPILFVTHVGDWPAVLLIGLAGAAHQAWSANLFTTVSDIFPKRAVATLTGLGGLAGATGGMIFPWLTGMMLDHFKAAGNVTHGYAVLFSICAFAYVVSFAINHALAPRFEPISLNVP